MALKLPGKAVRGGLKWNQGVKRLGVSRLGVRATLCSAVLVLLLQVFGAVPAVANPDARREIECLALTLYFEARGEPDEGLRAVGHVVMNRATHPRFPQGVCAVVQEGGEERIYRCQFTWWCDRKSDRPTEGRAWRRCQDAARRIYWARRNTWEESPDPTGGALWYHADYVQPAWRTRLQPMVKIGRHIFYQAADNFSDQRLARDVRTGLAGENARASETAPPPN